MGKYFLKHFILFIVIVLLSGNILSQNTRPVRDDVGFCWKPSEIESLIKYLDENNTLPEQTQKNLIAGISPHDDFLYAGNVYYPLYKNLRTKEVVVFGVTHGTVRKEIKDPQNIILLDDFSQWTGPLGPVSPSPLRELIKKGLNKSDFEVNDKAQSLEHSIEALVPFLQYYNKNIKITPIMVTGMSYGRMDSLSSRLSEIIINYIKNNNLKLGEDIVFLMSSDANHYGTDFNNSPYGEDENAHMKATENDKRISQTYINGPLGKEKIGKLADELWAKTSDGKPALAWCGRYSIPFGLLTTFKIVENIAQKQLNGKVLKYSDTWTEGVIPIKHTNLGLTAPFSLRHWVGFLSADFYLD